MRFADEQCRNEGLDAARTAVVAHYAARGRVFSQLLVLIKERAANLIAANVTRT